jgi:hypothetical protein
LFTEAWTLDRPAMDPEEQVFAVELEASRRDPYRQLSWLFHLVGVRRRGLADAGGGHRLGTLGSCCRHDLSIILTS